MCVPCFFPPFRTFFPQVYLVQYSTLNFCFYVMCAVTFSQSLEGYMKKHSGDLHTKHYLNLIGNNLNSQFDYWFDYSRNILLLLDSVIETVSNVVVALETFSNVVVALVIQKSRSYFSSSAQHHPPALPWSQDQSGGPEKNRAILQKLHCKFKINI